MSRVRAFLGLGGNIGDPERAMAAALRHLDGDGQNTVVRVSSLYRTPPWGKTDQPDFLNAVAEVETALAPRALLELCLEAEASLKRVRAERWGPRVIDIDILLYGGLQLREEGLEIPHPRMAGRAFVMVPLAEIAPDVDVSGSAAAARAAAMDRAGIVRLTQDGEWWRQSYS